MCRHAIIIFLEERESLKRVDPEFRGLVEIFHKIPYCATFGSSCAGHVRFLDNYPDLFWPQMFGSLNIIVCPEMPHIRALLETIQQEVLAHADVSFCEKKHVFGPPVNSRLRIYEIKIGDNGCLEALGLYSEQYLRVRGNEAIYRKATKRHEEIKLFWLALEKAVSVFCRSRNFKRFALKKRIDELMGQWKPENVSVGV